MIQSIFLLSPTGEVLIERHFRGKTSRSVCDYFWEKASSSLNHHGGLSTTISSNIDNGGGGIGGIGGIGVGNGNVGGVVGGMSGVVGGVSQVTSSSVGGSLIGSGGSGVIGSGYRSSDPLPLYDTVPPIMEITIDDMDRISTSSSSSNAVNRNSHPSSESKTDASAAASTAGRRSNNKVVYLFSILRDGLSYLAITHGEISPLLIIEFLHRIADIFVDYFGSPADESAIKDNFSTVYQLLEEILDNGWPLTTEPNALQAMIRPPTVMGKVCFFICFYF